MKKDNLSLSIIGGMPSLIILITTIIAFFDSSKSISGLILLIVASIVIFSGAVLSYFKYTKLSALATLSGSLIGLIGYHLASKMIEGVFVTSKQFLLLWFVSLLVALAVAVKCYAGTTKNEETNIWKRLNLTSLIIAIITVAFTIYLAIILALNGAVLTPIVCLVVVGVIIASKLISIVFNLQSGSWLMMLVPILLIMGMIPYEIGQHNSGIILSAVVCVLSFVLLISEIAFLKGKE